MGQLGSKYEKRPRVVPEANDDDLCNRVLLNASTLHCPICIEIFAETPLLLSCGHSFCESCLRRLPINPTIELSGRRVNSNLQFGRYVECPLCRRKTYAKSGSVEDFVTKNYVLESILDDIRSLSSDREMFVVFDETLKFENKRLNATLKEKDETIDRLKRSLEKNANYLLIFQIVAAVVGVILLKNWFFPSKFVNFV